MKEDLLSLFKMTSDPTEERPRTHVQEKKKIRRRIILRFKTKIKEKSTGRHYYVFWVSGYTHKIYSMNPDVFSSLGFYTEIEARKKFVIIDQEDDGRMTNWLRGLLLDKARGLISQKLTCR